MPRTGPIIDRGTELSGGADSILAFLTPEQIQGLTPEAVQTLSQIFSYLMDRNPSSPNLQGKYSAGNKTIGLTRQDTPDGFSPTFDPSIVMHESLHGLDKPLNKSLLASLFGFSQGRAIQDFPLLASQINQSYDKDITRNPAELFATGGQFGPKFISPEILPLYDEIFRPVPPPPQSASVDFLSSLSETRNQSEDRADFQRYRTKQERRRNPRRIRPEESVSFNPIIF